MKRVVGRFLRKKYLVGGMRITRVLSNLLPLLEEVRCRALLLPRLGSVAHVRQIESLDELSLMAVQCFSNATLQVPSTDSQTVAKSDFKSPWTSAQEGVRKFTYFP